jgi:hypothetical protein
MALNRSESSTTSETNVSKMELGPKEVDGGAPASRMPLILEDEELENMDAAAKALQGQDLTFTPAEERKVLRKIDWRLMPIMAWTCGLQVSRLKFREHEIFPACSIPVLENWC